MLALNLGDNFDGFTRISSHSMFAIPWRFTAAQFFFNSISRLVFAWTWSGFLLVWDLTDSKIPNVIPCSCLWMYKRVLSSILQATLLNTINLILKPIFWYSSGNSSLRINLLLPINLRLWKLAMVAGAKVSSSFPVISNTLNPLPDW